MKKTIFLNKQTEHHDGKENTLEL